MTKKEDNLNAPSRSSQNKGFLLAIFTSLLYGIMPSLTQLAYGTGLTAETVLTGRYLIGTSLIWVFILVTKRDYRIGKKRIFQLLLVGVNIFVCIFCMTSSYAYLPGAIASLLVFSYIVIVNLVELITKKTAPTPARIASLLLTVVGLVLVVYSSDGTNSLSIVGIALALSAGVLYTIWAMSMGAKVFFGFSSEVMLGFSLIPPTVLNVIKCLYEGYPVLPTSPEQWLYIGLLGLSPGFLAPVAFAASIRLIGAGTASIINTSEIVFAYLAGLIIMHDILGQNAIIGGVLIIIGILILRIMERK